MKAAVLFLSLVVMTLLSCEKERSYPRTEEGIHIRKLPLREHAGECRKIDAAAKIDAYLGWRVTHPPLVCTCLSDAADQRLVAELIRQLSDAEDDWLKFQLISGLDCIEPTGTDVCAPQAQRATQKSLKSIQDSNWRRRAEEMVRSWRCERKR